MPRFEAAGIPARPYAFSVDPTGESMLGLIEADELRRDSPRTVLADGDWISLQGICAD